MGIDWTRIMPKEPIDGLSDTVSVSAQPSFPFSFNFDLSVFILSINKIFIALDDNALDFQFLYGRCSLVII